MGVLCSLRRCQIGATVVVLTAIVLSGCADGGYKKVAGGVLGGALGAVGGAQFGKGKGQLAATAAGTLLGAFIGSNIGASLDELDRMQLQQAENRAQVAPVGQTITWNNPNSGNSGAITPIRDGTTPSGQYCREYQNTITVGGKQQSAYGTACQQPDGSWRIVK